MGLNKIPMYIVLLKTLLIHTPIDDHESSLFQVNFIKLLTHK